MVLKEKKRKHKDKSEKSKKKHKSRKSIETSACTEISTITAPNHSFEPNSSFSEVVAKLYIHLAPMWAGKTMEGVNEQLNAFLMKYGLYIEKEDI